MKSAISLSSSSTGTAPKGFAVKMSKGGKSKSSSRSSHSRSRSGSPSLSRSRSRSRSHSKKRRHSSRSRSRSHSPQVQNRERQYPRAYQNPNQNRDFRGQNRGYRRPFYFRQRGRGFYPRGQYNNNRGGYGNYRQNWHNYRPNYSPRRNRSRSRSPKRRSASPRSRSRSRNSYRSSSDRSGRSSSSRSSSPHSRSPPPKRKALKAKRAAAKEAKLAAQEHREADSKEKKASDTADRNKQSEGSSGTGQGSAALDASQASSAATSAPSPTRKSPLHSVVVKRSPALPASSQKTSPHYSPPRLHPAQQSTTLQSILHRTAPRQNTSPSKKSPPATSGSLKEENRSGDASPPAATYIRRYLEEQKNKVSGLDRENGREREQKAIELEKERAKEKSSASEMSSLKSEYYSMMNELEKPYRGSQSPKRKKHTEEYERCMAAAEFYKDSRYGKEDADEPEKRYKVRGLKASEFDDEPKLKSKLIVTAGKSEEMVGDRTRKWEGLACFPSCKDKARKGEDVEDELSFERLRREERLQAKRSEAGGFKELLLEKNFKAGNNHEELEEGDASPPPRRGSENRERDRLATREDSPPPGRLPPFSVHRGADVNIRMDALACNSGSSSGLLSHERRIAQELVHSTKKEQGFRSIFQHIQSSQARRSPSELFAQHIVTIVHHVKEHHFESSGMTLSERFTLYQRKAAEQEMAKHKKSPEIHRRIDISPSAFRKHPLRLDEKKKSRENSHKGEGKYQEDPVDLRLDIEQRKKYKEKHPKRAESRESVDSEGSSQSRECSNEKPEKHLKGSKKRKKQKKLRTRSRSSSTSSHSSLSGKSGEYPEELEEREEEMSVFDKSRLGPRDYSGPTERERGRGTFQLHLRGRGWNKGTFAGSSSSDFQKRTREEEWDPEYTPKSKKYYLHDDREREENEKWVNRGRGRSTFMRGRGRFIYKKTTTSPKWTHDKYKGSGEEGELEDDESEGEDKDEKKSNSNIEQ